MTIIYFSPYGGLHKGYGGDSYMWLILQPCSNIVVICQAVSVMSVHNKIIMHDYREEMLKSLKLVLFSDGTHKKYFSLSYAVANCQFY